ncbi:hypothetical protein [Bacillus benzoevorans]|uniref:YkzH n=1 Tax=Bacillus benzoevorans TaxID=1456 RepID=A0A7X0HUK0_9BACI|nr:hypothetical protein [Bacillus benzoevorans]MBB6447129.1 hypothetical protein [Bacillus benzoevorans]
MNTPQYFNPYYAVQPRNAQMDQINIHQRIINIEKQLDMLIKMVDYNNQMLRYMQQNNINTNAGGGGAIIVRM